MEYTNWNDAQPDNHNGKEHYLQLLRNSGKWNDNTKDYDGSSPICQMF